MWKKLAVTAYMAGSLIAGSPPATRGQTQTTPDKRRAVTDTADKPTFTHYASNVSDPSEARVILLGNKHSTPKDRYGELIAQHTHPGTQILHEQPPRGHLDSLDFRNPKGMDELLGSAIMQSKEQWEHVYGKNREAFTMYGFDVKNKRDLQTHIGHYLINTIADDYTDRGCKALHSLEQRSLKQHYRARQPEETLPSYVDRAKRHIERARDSIKAARQKTLENNMMEYVNDGDNTVVTVGNGHIDGQTGRSLTSPLRENNIPFYAYTETTKEDNEVTATEKNRLYNFIRSAAKSVDYDPSTYKNRYMTAFELGARANPEQCSTAD
jgi:hypothetical protein